MYRAPFHLHSILISKFASTGSDGIPFDWSVAEWKAINSHMSIIAGKTFKPNLKHNQKQLALCYPVICKCFENERRKWRYLLPSVAVNVRWGKAQLQELQSCLFSARNNLQWDVVITKRSGDSWCSEHSHSHWVGYEGATYFSGDSRGLPNCYFT